MTTLVFDSDEAVISARPGFEEAWEATPDANRVNVRPVALVQGAPGADGNTTQVVIPSNGRDWHTNMLVVTTRRLYNIELNVIDDKSAQQPAFQVSYRYPGEALEKTRQAEAVRQREQTQKQQQADIQQALNSAQTPRNWDYLKYPGSDSARIVPDFAYDDGRFTFVGFSPAKSIPSVTKELNGQEQVVNSSVRRKGDLYWSFRRSRPVWFCVPVTPWSAWKIGVSAGSRLLTAPWFPRRSNGWKNPQLADN